jgi:hypothetical protein
MFKTKRMMKSDMTQPMKAGCPKKPAAVEGGRMPNYSEDEEHFIAVLAHTNVTMDPIRRVGQKGENFGCKSKVNFACCNKKSWLNLANTFRRKPRIQSKRGGRRRLRKVCSYGISTSNN